MINKQLEVNVNNERILKRLTENLNVNFITDGSNTKKIADAHSSENLTFSTSVDTAIANSFTTSMSTEFLDLFGRQYNIFRKSYSSISLYSYQEAVELTVNKDVANITTLNTLVKPFKRGDIIYSDGNVVIEATNDVRLVDINSPVYVSVRISIGLGLTQYSIPTDASYIVYPSDSQLAGIIPSFTLTFKVPVGLAVIQEFEEDYRLRLYEATYLASNGANALVSAITKEVPLLYYTEVEDYKNGRGIRYLYPYTQELIDTGIDESIESHIIPLMEANLQNRVIYGQMIEIKEPQPLVMNAKVIFKEDSIMTDSYLDNVTELFNRYFSMVKIVDKDMMADFIKAELSAFGGTIEKIDFIFNSPYVSEETFNLTSSDETINLPLGRFLHLNSITRGTN